MDEILLLFERFDVFANACDLILDIVNLLLTLVKLIILCPFRQQLQSALSLKQFVPFDRKLPVLFRLIVNLLLYVGAQVLLLDLLDLHELIVDHLFRVLDDPLPNLTRVNLLVLLARLRRIRLLLLVDPLALLHGGQLFTLSLRLDVRLGLLALDRVEFALLPRDLALEICLLLGAGFLHLCPIFRLFFDFFHHCDFLRLHATNFLLHLLRFELLLVE